MYADTMEEKRCFRLLETAMGGLMSQLKARRNSLLPPSGNIVPLAPRRSDGMLIASLELPFP